MHVQWGGRRRTNANNLLSTIIHLNVDFLPIISTQKLLLSIQESQQANASICRAVPSTLGGWMLT